VSRANARQRRGRAGRVAVGVCVHLFTRHTHDCVLDEAQLPEVPIAPRLSRAGSPRRSEPAARRRFAHGR
jgi:alkanesulfonate monooxygenase SsuD/methylene tetrahydromethanopterin reductase-like flavin-dependent oxidoreductase (luciferase family)